MSDAARCRPEPPGRLAVARAAIGGALERAVDVAAALEVRGYSAGGKPARGRATSWSRHDLRVAAAALLLVLGTIALRAADAGDVTEYPQLEVPTGPMELVLVAVIAMAGALPFAGRGARLGVARG